MDFADIDAIMRDANYVLMSIVLISARLLAFIYISPFFSSRAMTRTVRLGMVVAIGLVTTPPIFADLVANQTGAERFVALILKEIVIGLLLGALIWVPVHGIEFAGVLLDTQRGSSMAQDYNVVFSSPQATPTAILLSQIFSGFFFSVGGFLIVLQIIVASVEIWPPAAGLPDFSTRAAPLFIELAGSLLLVGVLFALPISGFMLLADVAIAFLAKLAPTLNALTFGMPAKSAILVIMLLFYVSIAFPMVIEDMRGATEKLDMVLFR